MSQLALDFQMMDVSNDENDAIDTQRILGTVCQLDVARREQIRLLYRSDLQPVNLKRKLAGVGLLTEPDFARRLGFLQNSK